MIDWLTRWASGLRFPTLLALVGSLFVLDLILPDVIPFIDEVLLGLMTVLFASVRKRGSEGRDDAGSAVTDRDDASGADR